MNGALNIFALFTIFCKKGGKKKKEKRRNENVHVF